MWERRRGAAGFVGTLVNRRRGVGKRRSDWRDGQRRAGRDEREARRFTRALSRLESLRSALKRGKTEIKRREGEDKTTSTLFCNSRTKRAFRYAVCSFALHRNDDAGAAYTRRDNRRNTPEKNFFSSVFKTLVEILRNFNVKDTSEERQEILPTRLLRAL